MKQSAISSLLLAVATLLCLWPTSSFAHEGWVVDSVKVTGLPDGVGGVGKGLSLSARSGLMGAGEPVFREANLQADLQRLRLLLARHGYPYAEITHAVVPQQEERRVDVAFTVSSGRPVLVSVVRVDGAPSELAELTELALRALPAGGIFTDSSVVSARNLIAGNLARAGYALAKVDVHVERPDSFSAAPIFEITSGELHRITQLVIEGVSDDLVPLAHKSMGVPGGAFYSPDLVTRARDNLRELRLFRQIKVATAPAAPGELQLIADLKPAALRTLRFSVGSWTDDPIRLSGSWLHRNIFHQGRGLSFVGVYSPFYQELNGRAWWPAMFGPRSVSEFRAGWAREDEDGYELENRSLETAVLLRPVGRLSVRLGAALEDVIVAGTGSDSEAFTGPNGRQLVLSARFHDDHSDHLLYPSRGSRLSLEMAWSPSGKLSAAPFVSAEGKASVYAPLPAGVVLASRIAVGMAQPLGDVGSLLPNRRFFAGGVTSMRGHKRRRLGPLDGDDNPVGGQARLLAAAELRMPMTGWIDLATFIDAGQVWSDRSDFALNGLASAAGGGVVFHTPVGPVRIDFAHLLNAPRDGEPRNVFHLAIGHPF